jgi:error-prone DNA polymerase
MTAYAELQVTTNFSFLRGGSHPEELVMRAAAIGLSAIAVADRNTLAGVVRAHVQIREAKLDLKLIVGARIDLACGNSLLCFPIDRAAYGRLSRLLSLGRRRAPKGECELHLGDLEAYAEGQVVIALPNHAINPF